MKDKFMNKESKKKHIHTDIESLHAGSFAGLSLLQWLAYLESFVRSQRFLTLLHFHHRLFRFTAHEGTPGASTLTLPRECCSYGELVEVSFCGAWGVGAS